MMEKRKYYTQEDCNIIIGCIKDGYDCVKDLHRRTNDADAFFVYLFSDDAMINSYTVYYLPLIRKEENVSSFVIVTPYEDTAEMTARDCRVPYSLSLCTREDMLNIVDYYTAFPAGPNVNDKGFRTLVTGSGDGSRDRILRLIGYKGIDKRSIVAYAICKWYRIPDEAEVDDACSYEYVNSKASTGRIDWDKYKCREIPGPVEFPVNIDMGLDPILKHNINKDDKVVVFSYTKTSRYIVDALTGYIVDAMLDNNAALSGTVYKGVTVHTPQEYLAGEHRNDVKIIVPTRSYRAICEQLYEFGYKVGEQVFIAYIDVDYLHSNIYVTKFNNGKAIYDDIRNRHPDKRLYFITFPGTGDIYLAGMYLRDQMEHDGVDDGVLVIVGQNCRRVYDVLECDAEIAAVEVIKDHPAALDFGMFARLMGYEKLNICKLGHGNELLDTGFIRGNSGLDLNEVYQLIAHSEVKHTGIEVKTEDSTQLFEANGLKEGNTVIVSPYAKCMTQPPEGFWEGLALALMEKGFDVCTNVAGNEKPIQGTKGVMIQYSQVMDFVNRAGCFIGLRSGLCDILSGASAKKIILYGEDNRSGKDYHYNFCSLEKMGLAEDNLYEIILDADYRRTIDRITDVLI
jgi:hypothetical protein